VPRFGSSAAAFLAAFGGAFVDVIFAIGLVSAGTVRPVASAPSAGSLERSISPHLRRQAETGRAAGPRSGATFASRHIVEGGADVAEVYNFALVSFAAAALEVGF
jgi:hypothetical protein